jgi:heme-degrading monooxygenase HmoA
VLSCSRLLSAYVIVRISSAIVPSSEFDAYLEHLRSRAIPTYEAAAGLRWVALLQRPVIAYIEVMTVSVWKSEQAMVRFVESKLAKDNPANHAGVIQLDPHAYYLILSTEGRLLDLEDA